MRVRRILGPLTIELMDGRTIRLEGLISPGQRAPGHRLPGRRTARLTKQARLLLERLLRNRSVVIKRVPQRVPDLLCPAGALLAAGLAYLPAAGGHPVPEAWRRAQADACRRQLGLWGRRYRRERRWLRAADESCA